MLGIVLTVVGFFGVIAFYYGVSVELSRNIDPDKPRGIPAQLGVAVVSWPVRYVTYRSGHGSHART